MSTRREVMNYIGTAAIGSIVGYYVGAQELLGIQSEEVVRNPEPEETTERSVEDPTEGPTEEPTEEPTENITTSRSGLVSSGFPRFQHNNRNTGYPSDIEGPAGSPTARWTFSVDGNNHTTPAVYNGVAYFGGGGGEENQNKNVYAVNASSGDEIWRFENSSAFQSSAAVGERAVYIADNNGELFALDPDDGSVIWSAGFGQASYTASPVLANDRVYIGDPDTGGVFGFDTQTGEQVWAFSTRGGVTASPALAGGTIYVGTEMGSVYAVDTADGSVIWEFAAAGEVTGAPVIQNGLVFVTTATGAVQAISTENAQEEWRTETDEQIRSSPAIDDSSLYVGDGELFDRPGKLYSLSTDTGEIEWMFDTEGSFGGRRGAIIRSPAVDSERVYFGVDSNKVYAVNKDDGTEVWQFDTGVVLSSPAVLEGVVYIGADNDTVYALE